MDIPVPSSLIRDISPPRLPKRRKISHSARNNHRNEPNQPPGSGATPAAVEAGEAKVDDHLTYFTKHLSQALRATREGVPRISIRDFANLYERNQHEHGNHFVIHQHNHPKAGVHYDLRLQFSETSSLSFAVPKGLPGNPNSKSLGRMAVETRVHSLWNHLIESASSKTGSLLIWDTGTYSILPRKIAANHPLSPQTTDNDSEPNKPSTFASPKLDTRHENEKLIEAFQSRYVRLRLHGTRLPKGYTVTLRLPSANDIGKSASAVFGKRKRRVQTKQPKRLVHTDSEPETDLAPETSQDDVNSGQEEGLDTDEEEDLETRKNNAYPGATNSIGSIHQRNWYMTLDRRSSGFVPKKSGIWERDRGVGFDPFYVRGRDFESSVVTGRLAAEVESDEAVEGFVGRAGWVAITR